MRSPATGWPCPECGASAAPRADMPGLGMCLACGNVSVDPAADRVALPAGPAKRGAEPAVVRLSSEFRRRYELRRVLGSGGVGCVFLALDRVHDRKVAIKFLSVGLDDSERPRFYREGKILAGLRHPAIIRVLDLGEEESFPFMVLEYAPGGTLRTFAAREGPLAPARCAELIGPCLDALDLCHAHGIIHRDLKLQNVLLAEDGHAMLTDFGLARVLDHATLARTGEVAGTPATLAPEVVTGGQAGPPADIYAIGVMLFQLLTGTRPFDAETVPDLLMHHVRTPPPSLRSRRADLSAQLDSFVRQCLAKRPEDRPSSAAQLRRRLDLLVAPPPQPAARPSDRRRGNEPTVVSAPGRRARSAPPGSEPLATHAKPVLKLAVLATLTLSATVTFALWQWPRAAGAEHSVAANSPPLGVDASGTAPSPLASSNSPASPFSIASRRLDTDALLAGAGLRLGTGTLVEPMPETVALSSDGALLASSGNARGYVTVWDVATGRAVLCAGDRTDLATALAFSPDGRWLASAHLSGRLFRTRLPGTADERPSVVQLPATFRPTQVGRERTIALGWLADGHVVAASTAGGQVEAWIEGHGMIPQLQSPGPYPLPMRCRIDGARDRVLVVDGAGTVRLWALRTGHLIQTLPSAALRDGAFAWDASRGLLAVDRSGEWFLAPDAIEIRDLSSGKVSRRWKLAGAHPEACSDMVFVRGGQEVFVASNMAGTAQFLEWWNLGALDRPVLRLNAPDWIACLDASADGQRVAFATKSRQIVVFTASGQRLGPGPEAAGHQAQVSALAVYPDDRRLISAGADCKVMVWDALAGVQEGPAISLDFIPTRLAVRPSGEMITCSSAAGELVDVPMPAAPPVPETRPATPAPEDPPVLDVRPPDEPAGPTPVLTPSANAHDLGESGATSSVSVTSLDKKWLVAGTSDGEVLVRDAAGAATHWTLRARLPSPVSALAVSRSGRWLAVGCRDGQVRVLSMVEGVRVGAPAGPVAGATAGEPAGPAPGSWAGSSDGVPAVGSLGRHTKGAATDRVAPSGASPLDSASPSAARDAPAVLELMLGHGRRSR